VASPDRQTVQSVVGRQKSAVDLVLHEIRRSILNGDLPPGEPFTVPALTARLGVSHVPVREALRQLEAQGLIVLSPSRSAVVTPLEPEDLCSIYRLRLRLEPELAGQSAEQRTQEEIADFDHLVRNAFRGQLPEEGHWDMHRRFHAALIAPAAAAWDFRLLKPLWDATERYTRLVFDPVIASADAWQKRENAHDRLIAAAKSRNPERVRGELQRHLETNLAQTLEALQSMVKAGDDADWLGGGQTA
jgi:DNA-binding GntR family transcriptional regulator